MSDFYVVAQMEGPPPEPELVDSVEAAEMLSTNLNNIRQMVFKKRLTPVGKKHRRLLFSKADVQALAIRRSKG